MQKRKHGRRTYGNVPGAAELVRQTRRLPDQRLRACRRKVNEMDETSRKQNDLWSAVCVKLLVLYDLDMKWFLNRWIICMAFGEGTVKQSQNRRMQELLALITLLAYIK